MKNNIILKQNAEVLENNMVEEEAKLEIVEYIKDKTGFKVNMVYWHRIETLLIGCTTGKPNYEVLLKDITFKNIDSICEKATKAIRGCK